MIKSIVKLFVGLALIAFVIVVGPLLGIWALNTLFPVLAIPYKLETWAAFAILLGSTTGLSFGAKRK